ncbi:hypothetical protein [Azospirillum argentinense]|uniref:hypothetical protein n=1 Tax=Azospirillum argentinense TaxID=2970906 RepID=UPI0032DED773
MTTDTTAPLSAEELGAIEARHAKTTKGDWFRRCNYVVSHPHNYMIATASDDGTWLDEDANLDFIGHAHQDVPRLLADHRALSARVAELETKLRDALLAGGRELHNETMRAEAAEARATQAEALLSDLCRLTGAESHAAAVSVVATMLHGADAQAYGGVVRAYADTKAALSASQAREAGMREALKYARPFLRLHGCPTEPVDAALSPAQPAQNRRILAPWNPCLEKRQAGEPFFVLLGRDEDAAGAVRYWADSRALRRGPSQKTAEARQLADRMDAYRAGLLTTETEVSNG